MTYAVYKSRRRKWRQHQYPIREGSFVSSHPDFIIATDEANRLQRGDGWHTYTVRICES